MRLGLLHGGCERIAALVIRSKVGRAAVSRLSIRFIRRPFDQHVVHDKAAPAAELEAAGAFQ